MRRREERAAERSAQSSDTQHGPSFEKDAREAAKRREQNRLTPDQRLDNLIGKAARELGIKLPEENKHRDAKLFGQYKMLQNPKPPLTPLQVIRQKKA